MTKVATMPISTATGDIAYHAIAVDKQAHGKMAGVALDALAAQLAKEETGTFVIVQSLQLLWWRPAKGWSSSWLDGVPPVMLVSPSPYRNTQS